MKADRAAWHIGWISFCADWRAPEDDGGMIALQRSDGRPRGLVRIRRRAARRRARPWRRRWSVLEAEGGRAMEWEFQGSPRPVCLGFDAPKLRQALASARRHRACGAERPAGLL